MNYYLSRNGQRIGPYSADQVRNYLQEGLIGPGDQAWTEGWPHWLPIAQVPGILTSASPPGSADRSPDEIMPVQTLSDDAARAFCVWMHLSQFAAFITVLAGYILPLMVWQTGKRKHPSIDKQGRIIANWIISSLIYDVLTLILCFFWIGFLVAPLLMLMEVVFPIIGAIKASKGETWDYPLNIRFFKI